MTKMQPQKYIFAVMGVTGAGKSTFIKTYTGNENIKIGHDMDSCTSEVESYTVTLENGSEIVLLDTPGFDDSSMSETDVLTKLSTYLAEQYHAGQLLCGLIYVHSLLECRMTQSAQRNLKLFEKLCGKKAFRHVVLLTTKVSKLVDPNTRPVNEQRLREKYWSDMLDLGAQMRCFEDTRDSAQSVIDLLIDRQRQHTPGPLDIQRELVDEEKTFAQTTAGQFVHEEVNKALGEIKTAIRELTKRHEEAILQRDDEYAASLVKVKSEYEERGRKLEQDDERLWQGVAILCGALVGIAVKACM